MKMNRAQILENWSLRQNTGFEHFSVEYMKFRICFTLNILSLAACRNAVILLTVPKMWSRYGTIACFECVAVKDAQQAKSKL